MSQVRKGTYVLFITLEHSSNIIVGAKGPHLFQTGMYCYVGSAMAGLDQRLRRHLEHEKKLKWHIDYLTASYDSCEAWESYPDFVPECRLAEMAEACGGIPEMDGFGCSDCGCRTHLFRVSPEVRDRLIAEAGLSRFTSD